MIRPLTRLSLRVAALALAATLLAAASASAASKYEPWKPGQQAIITATAGSTMKIADDEPFSDPDITVHNLTGQKFGALGYTFKHFRVFPGWCGGGEVRGKLLVEGNTYTDDIIDVKIKLVIYEGSSCSTEDYDGQSYWSTLTLKPGETKSTFLHAVNEHEGGDSVSAKLFITAVKNY